MSVSLALLRRLIVPALVLASPAYATAQTAAEHLALGDRDHAAMNAPSALHQYEEAIEAFQESTKVEPDFAMGYWGEAMAHNHPLWSEQDIAAGVRHTRRLAAQPILMRS